MRTTDAKSHLAAPGILSAGKASGPGPLGLQGLGIGWRPELALAISRRPNLSFLEITAENHDPTNLPPALLNLNKPIIPHGISLSLGGADPIDPVRAQFLSTLAQRTNAPFVSEHIAFVRAGDKEAGHLLPIPRTRASLNILIENINAVQQHLCVPLALENISTLFEWPNPEIPEPDFLTEVLERTDTLLLLDIANIWANARNFKRHPAADLDNLPLHRIAYIHVGGGIERDGVYHDTHAHPAPDGILDLLEELCTRIDSPAVMLERDDHYPPEPQLNEELNRIAAAMTRGAARRTPAHAG